MRLSELSIRQRIPKVIAYTFVLAMLFSLLGVGTASATNKANDSSFGQVNSLTIKVGTATITNPTTVYTTAKVFTPADMVAMANVTQAYSYIDSMPTGVIDAAKGVKITDLLAAAGIDFSKVYRIYFYANDVPNGPYINLTRDYLWGSPRYYFPNIKNSWDQDDRSPDLSGAWGSPTDGAVPVDPILAVQDNWERIGNIGDPLVDYSAQNDGSRYRLINGQTMHDYADFHGDLWFDNPNDPNTSTPTAPKCVKWNYELDVQLVTDGNGFTLNKTSDTVSVKGTDQLLPSFTTGTPPSTTLTWSSDNTSIATVSSNGTVTGKAAGAATITATGGGHTATCNVTVQTAAVPVDGITLNKPSSIINVPNKDNGNQLGVEQLFYRITPSNASNKAVTYDSSNTAVATVNSSGTVTAVSGGAATITATTKDGSYTATCDVTVQNIFPASTLGLNKATDTIAAGATDQLTATIAPANATDKTVTWASDNPSVATVVYDKDAGTAYGMVTGVSPGTASISATTADGNLTVTCGVTVTGIALDKASDTIAVDATDKLTARVVLPANATGQNVIWTSDNPSVATVVYDATVAGTVYGMVTGVSPGTANITVTTADGIFSDTCNVTVVSGLAITTTGLPDAAVGVSYSVYATASGGTLPYTWSVSGLPGGLGINTVTGEVYGIPIFDGNFSVVLSVYDRDAALQACKTIGLYVGRIQSVSAVNGTVTVTLSAAPTAAPVLGDFAVTQSINDGDAKNVKPSAISASGATVTLTVPQVVATTSAQNVVVSVSYRGGTPVKALAFTISAQSPSPGGGGGGPTTTAVTSTTGSATVTPANGGTVSLGSDAKVSIPAGALQGSAAVNVSVQKVSSPPSTPSGFMILGSVYEFSVGSSTSYSFAKPVTLTFTFDPATLASGETPSIYYYDQTKGQWVSLGGAVSGNTITITVDHFTKFAVLVKGVAPPPVPAQLFSDVPASYWASDAITSLANQGYISGYPDGAFKPGSQITRAEFVSILDKALKLPAYKPATANFSDVSPADWYYETVESAVYAGIVKGEGSAFAPSDPVTREQMAVMIAKAAQIKTTSAAITFSDSDKVSAWARDALAAVAQQGVMKGYPDGTFNPQGQATRAEAAAVIAGILK